MGKKTVAELLVETLISREVPRIYRVAGDSLNGITDFHPTTRPASSRPCVSTTGPSAW
jgi:hypothetical protein